MKDRETRKPSTARDTEKQQVWRARRAMWATRAADQEAPRCRLFKSWLSPVSQSLEVTLKSKRHKPAIKEPSRLGGSPSMNTERAFIAK